MNASDDERESRIERSWRVNADAWTRAVREQRIASRKAGTDAAIVEAVAGSGARRVADLGCGEGWLARALAARGCEVVGIDASPELIAAARELGGARFESIAYADLVARALGRFDAAVFNFALLGDDLRTPLTAARSLLADNGLLFIQTVHPWLIRRRIPRTNAVVLPHAAKLERCVARCRIRDRRDRRTRGGWKTVVVADARIALCRRRMTSRPTSARSS